MRRKPILLSKVLEGGKSSRESIGLIGAHHGAGVTYTGLLMAFYMGEELGKKTIFLECNKHHDMELMQAAFEWSREDSASFSFGNVTIFKDISPLIIPEIYGDDYECCILDFGTDFLTNRDEFLRCGKKIILGGQGEWNRQKLLQFIQTMQSARGSNTWIHLIPCAGQKVINSLRSESSRVFYSVPYEADPTMPSKETSRLFDILLY